MDWTHLIYARGWNVYWEKDSGRMYAKSEGLLSRTYHFPTRHRDRAAAIAVAKAWLHS